jgi:hypothetical protein
MPAEGTTMKTLQVPQNPTLTRRVNTHKPDQQFPKRAHKQGSNHQNQPHQAHWNFTRPVRPPSTPAEQDRPKSRHQAGSRSSPPTPQRWQSKMQLHSKASRTSIISQVVESVALLGDSDKDVHYRNDSLESAGKAWSVQNRR